MSLTRRTQDSNKDKDNYGKNSRELIYQKINVE